MQGLPAVGIPRSRQRQPASPASLGYTHSPWAQSWSAGHLTPVQGSGAHAPMAGSQTWFAPHAGAVGARHGSATHSYPPSRGKHTSPGAQAAGQPVATQVPSMHTCPPAQFTPAQESKQPAAEKSALGLHACLASQVLGSQGSSVHAPALQISPASQAGEHSTKPPCPPLDVEPPMPLPAAPPTAPLPPLLPPMPRVAPAPPPPAVAATPPVAPLGTSG